MWYMLAIVGDSIHLFTILFIQQMTCRATGRRRPAGRAAAPPIYTKYDKIIAKYEQICQNMTISQKGVAL